MFAGSSNIINGGTFLTSLQSQEKGFKLLRDNVAAGAFHNSGERYDPPRCHPGTREVIIQEIMKWIETIDKEQFILWLYGPAGAGKSAIAQTIAELCYKAGLLAASFAFSRAAVGRNDATLLIPTLAYQLTISIPEILEHVSSAVDKDPLVFTRSLDAQLETLILEPLSKVPLYQKFPNGSCKWHLLPRLIIIDGLDECADAETQRYTLITLSSSLRRYPVPLIFLIASRPEQVIRDTFNQDWMDSLTNRLVLDDRYQPDVDIRRFLHAKFAEIRRIHILRSRLPSSWPSESDMDRLVQKSSGQFIYASTVIKFVQSPRHRPTERLDIIFGLQTPGNQAPFAQLDALYSFIFASVDDIEAVLDVFMLLLLLKSSAKFPKDRISVVEAFWGYQPGDLQIILADMHSVISVPLSEDKLRIYHVSLGDFLVDRTRSGRFFIDSSEAHTRLAKYCVKHTSTILKHMPTDESMNRVHLQISCQCFMAECLKAHPTEELLQELRSFGLDKFLALPSVHMGISIWDITRSNLPEFFAWLQRQCNPNHIQGCLCKSYIAMLDSHLLEALPRYPSSDPDFQYLLTAFALDTSPFDYNIFVDILSRYPSQPKSTVNDLQSLDGPVFSLGKLLYQRDYFKRSVLSAFLNDRGRSEGYYRDNSKYTDLAIKLLQHLYHGGMIPKATVVKHPSADECAFSITMDILSRMPGDPQVVKFVRGNSIRQDVAQREEIVLAMKAYIQKYDRSSWRWMPGWLK